MSDANFAGPALKANPRGEVAIQLGGRSRRLCLTLNALSGLETHFAVNGFSALAARLRCLDYTDFLVLLGALLDESGPREPSLLVADGLDVPLISEAIALAFESAFA